MKKIVVVFFVLALGVSIALFGERIFNLGLRGYLAVHGIQAKTLEQGSARIFYYEGGEEHDQTVILLHGVGGYALSSWFRLMPELVDKYHVIAPDLFFANLPDMVHSGYDISSEEWLVRLLYSGKNVSSASLVGLSFGAWPALRLAEESPDMVDSIVLISPLDGSANETVSSLALDPVNPGKDFYHRIFHSAPPVPSMFLKPHWDRTSQVFRALPKFRQQLDSYGRFLNANLHKVACPVLVLYGKEDRVIGEKRFRSLVEALPKGEGLGLEDGHAVVWDQPGPMAEAVIEFLGREPIVMGRKGGFTLIEVLVTLVVISVGAMAVMKFGTEAQDLKAEITHLDTMSRLAVMQMQELENEGYSSSTNLSGEFEDYPGYEWEADTSLLRTGGWYRLELTVRRLDTKRTVVMERVFVELLQ